MGWFKKVISVLGNDDDENGADEHHSIELSELPEWVDERAKSSFEKIKPKVDDKITDFFDERKALLKNLDELSVAQLHNPDISEREKQIMEGNRQAYINQHKQFANWIEFPTDLTLTTTANFCKHFEELLVKLAKSSAKGHAVLSEFFANYANSINKNVKTMSDSVNKIREILEESDISVNDLDVLKKAVMDLKTKKKFITDIEHESKVFRTKLANSNSYKDKLMKKMEELKLTDGYREFKTANKNKENHKQQMKAVEEDIHSLFSAISRPMKKYERIVAENASLFVKYVDDPVSALFEDEGLLIFRMLSNMKRAVNDGKLGFDDKEKEKVSVKIDAITKDKLSTSRWTYIESKKAAKKIDDGIRMNGTLQELDDLSYKVEHTDGQINLLEEKIDKAKKSLDKVNLEKMRDDVVNQIKDVLNADVSITWHQPASLVKEAEDGSLA